MARAWSLRASILQFCVEGERERERVGEGGSV